MNQELIALLTILPGLLENDCSLTAYNEFIRITLEKAQTFDKRSLIHKKYGTEKLCPVYAPLSTECSTLVPMSSLTEEELKHIFKTKSVNDSYKESLRLEKTVKVKDDKCIQQ